MSEPLNSLSAPRVAQAVGFAKGLINYGDRDFYVYLHRTFTSSKGYRIY